MKRVSVKQMTSKRKLHVGTLKAVRCKEGIY